MSNTVWYSLLENITPFVFKVKTPRGHRTGFQIHFATNSTMCGIATAFHVIEHAHEWEEPIKILHYNSGKSLLLGKKDRAMFIIPENDLAIILFPRGNFR